LRSGGGGAAGPEAAGTEAPRGKLLPRAGGATTGRLDGVENEPLLGGAGGGGGGGGGALTVTVSWGCS